MASDERTTAGVFHEGERRVQARLGVRGIERWARQVVRDHLPAQHRRFHTSLPFLVVAARDGLERPWITLLAGDEGFVTTPDERSLTIAAAPSPGDALEDAFAAGADVGLLGIDLASRRRNRLTGRVAGRDAGAIDITVDQTFGNCPQHIRERTWRRVDARPARAIRSRAPNPAQRAWIADADTFFIASGYRGRGESAAFGMDASHRGGPPGFVRWSGEKRLVFPDYAGNNHFNTLGNLELDARVGLTFVDFEGGSLLQITGRATIDWDSPERAPDPDARRLVHVDIDEVVEVPHALPLRWRDEDALLPLRVRRKVRESEDVVSFELAAVDGQALPSFDPGAYLPIEAAIDDAAPMPRTYSLSNLASDGHYRITVKRDPRGRVSRWLHDAVEVGDVLRARTPRGDFTIGCARRPIVLVSAGVGITPMVSLLRGLLACPDPPPIWFVHGARNRRLHPLAEEVARIESTAPEVQTLTFYSAPEAHDLDRGCSGRIDAERLLAIGAGPDADYYICGPSGLMAEVGEGLVASGVAPERIHTESFGAG